MQASDCSWLYYDSQLLEPILASMVKRPELAHQLPYILAAFLDAHTLLLHEPKAASQAQPSQAEPVQTEPGQTESSHAKPSWAALSQAEPSQAEPKKVDLGPASQADVSSLTQVNLLSVAAELLVDCVK